MHEWTSEREPERELLSYYDGQPVLVPGDAGEQVAELCRLLSVAGQETDVAAGKARAILDDAVYAAVEAFRQHAGVEDELTRGGQLKIVGPATWAALVRADAA